MDGVKIEGKASTDAMTGTGLIRYVTDTETDTLTDTVTGTDLIRYMTDTKTETLTDIMTEKDRDKHRQIQC